MEFNYIKLPMRYNGAINQYIWIGYRQHLFHSEVILLLYVQMFKFSLTQVIGQLIKTKIEKHIILIITNSSLTSQYIEPNFGLSDFHLTNLLLYKSFLRCKLREYAKINNDSKKILFADTTGQNYCPSSFTYGFFITICMYEHHFRLWHIGRNSPNCIQHLEQTPQVSQLLHTFRRSFIHYLLLNFIYLFG